MKLSSDSTKLPESHVGAWSIFNKAAKPMDGEFEFKIDFSPRYIEDASSSVCETCKKCGAFYIPGTMECPLCQPSSLKILLLGESNSMFLNRMPGLPTPTNFHFFAFEAGFDESSIADILGQLSSRLSKPEFGSDSFFGFGFVSSIVSVFQGTENLVHFGALSSTISPLPFLLPISQHMPVLPIVAKASARLLPAKEHDSTEFIKNLKLFLGNYNFSNVFYFFRSKIDNLDISDFGTNLHLIHISENEDENTKAFAQNHASSYIHTTKYTEAHSDMVVDKIRNTLRAPIKLYIKSSDGIAVSVHPAKFVTVKNERNKILCEVLQNSSDSEVRGTFLYERSYGQHSLYSVQFVAEIAGYPHIILNSLWERNQA